MYHKLKSRFFSTGKIKSNILRGYARLEHILVMLIDIGRVIIKKISDTDLNFQINNIKFSFNFRNSYAIMNENSIFTFLHIQYIRSGTVKVAKLCRGDLITWFMLNKSYGCGWVYLEHWDSGYLKHYDRKDSLII